MKLSDLKKPFIWVDIAETTTDSAVKRIDEIERTVKADAFGVGANLRGRLQDVFAATNKPCIVGWGRPRVASAYSFRNPSSPREEDRVAAILRGFDAGASAVFVELDTFDFHGDGRFPALGSKEEKQYAISPESKPTEETSNSKAVRKQKQLAAKIHSMGGEVVMSSHTQIRIRKDEVLRLGRTMEARGADFIKIVILTYSAPDVLKMLDSVVSLKETIHTPFNLMNQGDGAKLGRLLSPLCGSSWIICRAESGRYFYASQPRIAEARAFLETFRFPDEGP